MLSVFHTLTFPELVTVIAAGVTVFALGFIGGK